MGDYKNGSDPTDSGTPQKSSRSVFPGERKLNKPPAFLFYVKDWLTSKAVIAMSPTQRGYYIQLLAHAWDSDRPGYLPNDPALLWKLAGARSRESFERESALVLAQFPKAGRGVRANTRLVNERRSQMARSERLSRSGSAGAAAKWGSPRGPITRPAAGKLQAEGTSGISNLDGDAIVSPMAKNGSSSSAAFASSSDDDLEREPISSSSSVGKSDDDDSALQLERKIEDHIDAARGVLLSKGFPAHVVDAGLQLIEERSDYSGTIPSSAEYFIAAFNRAMADARDKALINKRAKRRERIMPSLSEMRRQALELDRESRISGRPIKETIEIRARARG